MSDARQVYSWDALELELLQELAVLPRATERVFLSLLLDVAKLVVDVGNGRQQTLEIHRPSAQHGIMRAVRHHVLKMKAPVPLPVALEIGERIAPAHHHVAD